MKYFLVLFIIIFSLSSCKKETQKPEEEIPHGNATALKNGDSWLAVTWSKLSYLDPSTFGLLIENYTVDGYRRGSLHFRRIPYENGTFFFNIYDYVSPQASDTVQTCTFDTLLDDGDVAGDAYQLVRDSAAWLTVRITDASTGDIEGEFSAEFVKWLYMGEEYDPASPDTIIFTNGTYHARVQK